MAWFDPHSIRYYLWIISLSAAPVTLAVFGLVRLNARVFGVTHGDGVKLTPRFVTLSTSVGALALSVLLNACGVLVQALLLWSVDWLPWAGSVIVTWALLAVGMWLGLVAVRRWVGSTLQ